MLQQILGAGAAAVAGRWMLFLVLVAGTAIALLVERLLRDRLPRAARVSIHGLSLAAGIGAGLWLAWQVLFLCDDAYISFRYARNLAEGNGLVFNVGEWVEGYTNFLWTAFLGGLGWLGIDIPYAALFGCLVSYVVAVLLTAAVVRRASPGPTLIPFAAIALAASAPFTTFASSGLETMPAAMLVVLAIWLTVTSAAAWLPGLVLIAAAMARPDHILFWGCMGLALVGEDLIHRRELPLLKRLDWKRYLLFGAPLVLVYVPYFLLRWKAYGDFFPNTYYAKSGHLTYWEQGWVYATHFVSSTGAWAWIPAALWALWGKPRARHETRLRLFALLAVPLFARYVIKVGGDFMEYRFFVPLLPIVAVAAESSLRWRLARAGTWVRGMSAGFAALGIGAALLPIRLVPPGRIQWFLAMEPSYYGITQLFPLQIGNTYANDGEKLAKVLTDRGITPPLAAGAIGMLGYYSRLPIVDALGLVNRMVAHKPISLRGRPGHEKQATREEMIDQGALIDLAPKWGETWMDQTRAQVEGLTFYFLRFDPSVVSAIARIPGAKLPRPEQDAERIAREAPRDRVVEAVAFYGKFLEGHPARAKVLTRLQRRLASVGDFEDGLPAGATLEGNFSVARPCPIEQSGTGCLGSTPTGKGSARIPFAIAAGELRMLVAGYVSDELSVRLEVDGAEVRRTVPSDATAFVPVVWDVAELIGKNAVLVIEDSDPVGGILVDAIHFPAEMGDLRQRIATAAPVKVGALLREAEATLPLGDPDLARVEERVLARWDLDALPPEAVVSGTAFGDGPMAGSLPSQLSVRGWRGKGYLNSFHGGDTSVGTVALPGFVIGKEPISLLIGGSIDCENVYVGLEVEGRVVTRACAKGDEQLRPAQIAGARWAGRKGRIVIVDGSRQAWGHILADDIVVTGDKALPLRGTAN